MTPEPYHADPSLKGKLRRHLLRLAYRQPAAAAPPGPMVSFTFDDAPVSAFTAGADLLERHGGRGTFFVCAGTAGETGFVGPLGAAAHIQNAARRGHEIACHTFSHQDCARLDGIGLVAEADRNAQAFAGWGVSPPHTFAYPYGEVGAAAKRAVGARFSLGRGLHAGLVRRGGDLAQSPAVGIEGETGEARALHWIDRAARQNAWLILYTHGVEEAITPYGCTRDALQRVIAHAVRRGLEIVTAGEGARRMRAVA